MRRIKFIAAISMCMLLLSGMTACGSTQDVNEAAESGSQSSEIAKTSEGGDKESTVTEPNTASGEEEQETSAEPETSQSETTPGTDTLVIVFSATGTTKGIAERIAAMEDADFYEITAAQVYTADDLNYNDSNSRTTIEQNDKSVRPEISSETIDLSGYSTIYIGYPIWWGEEPRIMDTFVESYDFADITMIPFCTSGGSGIGRSGSNLAENAGSGNWQDGDRLQSSISDADLQTWINKYK